MRSFVFTTLSLLGVMSGLHGAVNLSETYSSFIAFGDNLTDDEKFNNTPFEPGLPGLDGR